MTNTSTRRLLGLLRIVDMAAKVDGLGDQPTLFHDAGVQSSHAVGAPSQPRCHRPPWPVMKRSKWFSPHDATAGTLSMVVQLGGLPQSSQWGAVANASFE